MAGNNKWARLWQHWCHPRWRVERHLPTAALQQLGEAIGRSEQQHSGQIRFVIESRWHSADILQGLDTRRRAWQWFGELGVWDTEHNCGVLVYVSFADHRVEIVADRGIAAQVPAVEWQAVCAQITAAFAQQQYVAGLEQGLAAVTVILSQHFPRHLPAEVDELPNDVVLR